MNDILIAAVDVDYRGAGAVAAGVWFRGWTADTPEAEAALPLETAAVYEPGQFFRRELPCLLAVLERGSRPDVVIVDGYVWLGAVGDPGLGAHLFAALGRGPAVVGVAKTRYRSATCAEPVVRGGSRAPLYVTAAGMGGMEAARHIERMHGPYRVPTLLRRVDRLARTAAGGGAVGVTAPSSDGPRTHTRGTSGRARPAEPGPPGP